MASSAEAKRARSDDEPLPNRNKRTRTSADRTENVLTHGDYNIGWICALPTERAAAEAMLDYFHDSLPNAPLDINSYTLGNIGAHNIVIACLPSGHYGTNNAVAIAKDMTRSFPSLDILLMVGIGGGAPTKSADIRLGDVVVGEQVIQYDFGKALSEDQFHCTGLPIRPRPVIMTAISKLRALHCRTPTQIPDIVSNMIQRYPGMSNYARPIAQDMLFRSSYSHPPCIDTCEMCDPSELEDRALRASANPKVHYGKIGSGNLVIKDAALRDTYANTLQVACFEMEAAGLMDNFTCLVIRGICDYSDSHKNKEWQDHAAAVAAAYAKELLPLLPAKGHQGARVPTSEELALDERRNYLLESLDFEQRETRHATITAAHAKTCEWFLKDSHYVDWLNPTNFHDHHGFLWISGKPGAGKSTLMKFCFTHAQKEAKLKPDTTVISFFFNARGVELEKSTAGMYRSLLHQLIQSFPDLQNAFDEFDFILKDQKNDIVWNVEVLQALFGSVIQKIKHRRVVCYIDALDECDEEEVRSMIEHFEKLGEIASQTSTQFYICFSSRHYPYIRIHNGKTLTLEDQSGHTEDLEKYIRGKLKAGKGKGADDIRIKILDKSAGVFMWVILVINILNKEYQAGRLFAVKRRLQEVPAELGQLFKQILTRDTNNMDDLLLCVQWILYAKRPLRPEEFYFALVSGLDPTETSVKWNPEIITFDIMDRFLLSSSKGLAELTKSKKNKTVQFIHESVRDYLIKENGIYELWPEHASDFEAFSHDRLKVCCDQYLKVDIMELVLERYGADLPTASSRDGKDLRKEIAESFPFLDYATSNILYHAEKACSAIPQNAFLRAFDIKFWLERDNLLATYDTRRRPLSTCLMYVLAENNSLELLKVALKISSETNAPVTSDCLIAATSKGHATVATLLLDVPGIDVNVRDESGRSPIILAAEKGYDEITKLLLASQGVEVNFQNNFGRTALSSAARYGHEKIITLLLANENVDIVCKDRKQDTALSLAVRFQHEGVVKLLLATKFKRISLEGERNQTPLSLAVTYYHEEIVRLLINDGEMFHCLEDESGQALLSLVARQGSEALVKFLTHDKGVDPNSRDESGRTALSYAALNGHEAIVKLLLETKGVDFDSRDNSSRTALLWAATGGHEAIIKLPLKTKAVDPDSRDNNGRTALLWVAIGGHEAIMKLLLETKTVNTDSRDNNGRTALSWAASHGHEAVVKLLLETKGVDPDSRDNNGRTALSWAASHGHKAVVKLLLENETVDPNIKDGNDHTPLSLATGRGHDEVAKLLQARNRFWKISSI